MSAIHCASAPYIHGRIMRCMQCGRPMWCPGATGNPDQAPVTFVCGDCFHGRNVGQWEPRHKFEAATRKDP